MRYLFQLTPHESFCVEVYVNMVGILDVYLIVADISVYKDIHMMLPPYSSMFSMLYNMHVSVMVKNIIS